MTTTIDPGMGATTRTSTSSPRPAQRSHELTSRRLYTFGAVILGLIVVLASVAIVGSRSQNSAAAEANEIAEMRSQLQTADMMHDAIRAVVFGSGLESQIGAEAVAELRTELDENIAVFADSIATAQSVPTSNEQITQLLEETAAKVDVYGQTSIDLFGHLADVSSPDADVAADASSRFDAWTAAFEDLKTSMETTTEVIGVEGERIVDASSTTSSRSIVTVLIALLVAIGLFVFVWRRVLVSVGQTNRLKAESDRISAMVENSPTNTMYCGTDLTIQYMNPASFRTMRSIERLLPCKVDEIVGKSIDIFHTTPERARKMLADPERFLPHTAQIHVGDEIMELNVCAIRDADGTYIGAMATWSLVTDKVRVEREAAELHERERVAAAELAAKVAALDETLASAAAGDLTARVTVTGDDAIGRMGQAVEKLLGDLRGSIHSIAANSEALAAAAEELQVVSSQMGSNSAETSRQVSFVSDASVEVSRNVETVSAASEQMSSSIKEIARNAAEAAKVATQAVEQAKVTNQTVSLLGDSSAEIGQIVKVITGIAQQTNLLALNATIEAARAGEAGKGFAVVANEVKELAKETAKATEDISAKIEAIQNDTTSSVDSITGILTIIDQIAHFQDTIAAAVEEQAATTSEIARSVGEASRGSQEITNNMHAVAGAAESTAAGANDSSRAASELARMASDLQSLVGQFRY